MILKKEDENIYEYNKEEEKIINDIEDVNVEEKEQEIEVKEESKKKKVWKRRYFWKRFKILIKKRWKYIHFNSKARKIEISCERK